MQLYYNFLSPAFSAFAPAALEMKNAAGSRDQENVDSSELAEFVWFAVDGSEIAEFVWAFENE